MLFSVFLASGIHCRKPAESAPVADPIEVVVPVDPLRKFRWESTSRSGAATLSQSSAGATACSISCNATGKRIWTRAECLARDTDFRFVSDDCRQTVILFDYPKITGARPHTAVGLVVLDGKPPIRLRLSRFVQDPTRLPASKNHLAWLAGAVGQPGSPPRYQEDGAGVEFDAINSGFRRLSFARLAAEKDTYVAPKERSDRDGLFVWVDEEYSTQITTWGEIPPQFRTAAKPMTAEINVVGGPPRVGDESAKSVDPTGWLIGVGTSGSEKPP